MSEQISARRRIYAQLEPSERISGLSPLNWLIMITICLSVIVAILETEITLLNAAPLLFAGLDIGFGLIFTAEYIARLWVAPERAKYRGPIGRLRYMASPWALVDLAVVLPFWLGGVHEAVVLRLLRGARIIKLARIPGVSAALRRVITAIKDRQEELIISVALSFALMLFAATTLYMLEHDVQPEAFGSIPRAMWWGVATLTTVGYGDVYPVTGLGRLAAGFFALAGVGLVAMPAGIFASAMVAGAARDHHD